MIHNLPGFINTRFLVFFFDDLGFNDILAFSASSAVLFIKYDKSYIVDPFRMILFLHAIFNADKKTNDGQRIHRVKLLQLHLYMQSARPFQNIFRHLFIINLQLVRWYAGTVIQLSPISNFYRTEYLQVSALILVAFPFAATLR